MTIPLSHVILDSLRISRRNYQKITKINSEINQKYQKRLKKRNTLLNANSPFIITNEILEHHYNDFEEPRGEGEIILLQD